MKILTNKQFNELRERLEKSAQEIADYKAYNRERELKDEADDAKRKMQSYWIQLREQKEKTDKLERENKRLQKQVYELSQENTHLQHQLNKLKTYYK